MFKPELPKAHVLRVRETLAAVNEDTRAKEESEAVRVPLTVNSCTSISDEAVSVSWRGVLMCGMPESVELTIA